MTQITLLDPKSITVREGLDRYRSETSQLEALHRSILKHGQLVPIIITDNNELIAGGRRLATHITYNLPTIACIVKSAVSDDLLREIEFEENIQRQDFTPADYAKAVNDLHQLKCKIHGVIRPGQKASSGWTLEKTAALLNITQARVSQLLQIATYVKDFSALAECKTSAEIVTKVKSLETQMYRAKGIVKFDKEYAELATQIDKFLFCKNFGELDLEPNSVDLIITDPPYNINIDKIAISATGQTGDNTGKVSFEDVWSEDSLSMLIALANKFIKPTGHFIAFCSIEQFNVYKILLERQNFIPYPRPLVFTKTLGTSNNPDLYPLPRYEIAVFARRHNSKLIQSFPDVISFPNEVKTKQHINEKPVSIGKYLSQVTTIPNGLVLDLCMGSGNLLIGALQAKMRIVGCDISKESFELAKTNILNYLLSLIKEKEE